MAGEALSAWRELLGELGALGEGLCRAIEADDVLGAIAAMMQMRRVRSAIARVEAPLRLDGTREEVEALGELSALTVAARGAEAAMVRWGERPLPALDVLLASPLGVVVAADAMLPAVWDFETDLVVLSGDALAPVAEVLASLGQRRMLVHGTAAHGICVADAAEAVTAVRTMVPNPPRIAAFRTLGDVTELASAVRDALADLRIHRNTVHAFSRTWIEQGTRNLAAIARAPSVAAVGERCAGVPMIIVAPGPSLAKNIEQLRALDGRAIVCAFSHSLKPVVAAGVVPDLVLTVDPQDVRYHFAGCDLSRTCVVNAATAHPALFDLPARRFMTLSANCAIDDWIFEATGEDASVPGGGSVATTAFSLALRWRCDPIIFLGLDLSFPGGEYYVATSSDGGARARIDERGMMRVEGWSAGFRAMKAGGGPEAAAERTVELPGWHGGTVPSSFMFSLFHRWFVERMRDVTGPRVINCTEGGAYIEGMDHRPLAGVLAELETRHDIAAMLDVAVDPARTARVASHFRGVATRLRRCRSLATAGRDLIARGIADHRLVRVERALTAALRPLVLASLLAQRELDRAHDLAHRRDGDHLAGTAALLETLIAVIDDLHPSLATAVAQIAAETAHAA
jgi:hypothetical protein